MYDPKKKSACNCSDNINTLYKTQSAVKSAESKSAQLSKNLLYFCSVQDFETLRKFVHCRPVGESFEDTGDKQLFDDRSMRECSEYWAACLSTCK